MLLIFAYFYAEFYVLEHFPKEKLSLALSNLNAISIYHLATDLAGIIGWLEAFMQF